jgi:DNA-binding GntR family transcriptional regulator
MTRPAVLKANPSAGSATLTVNTPAQSSVDAACTAIREAIRGGHFKGGDRIREIEICELASVSRTSVRQALTLLAAEGFVELRQNRGAVVIDWSDSSVLEIFDLRAILEGYGASLAASRATPQETQQLRLEAQTFHKLVFDKPRLDLRLISESNNRLHLQILDAGKNPRLASMLIAVVHIPLVRQTFAKYSRESLERSATQHLDLVSAIEARDPVWAEAAMRAHVHAAKKVIFDKARRTAAPQSELNNE